MMSESVVSVEHPGEAVSSTSDDLGDVPLATPVGEWLIG